MNSYFIEMDHEFVKDQLEKLGYKDLDDDIIEEFLEKLQEDGDLPVIPTIPKRFYSEKHYKENITQKKSTFSTKTQKNTNLEKKSERKIKNNSKKEEIIIKSSRTVRTSHGTKTSHGMKTSQKKTDSNDREISELSQRLKLLKNKGKELDEDIKQCKLAITNSPNEIVDVPIYFGPNANNQRDPYPVVSIRKTGGFIRPPPIRGTRKHIHPNGHKLTYEERFPYYIPVPERRQDELRWKIRQKLIYSDPKYH